MVCDCIRRSSGIYQMGTQDLVVALQTCCSTVTATHHFEDKQGIVGGTLVYSLFSRLIILILQYAYEHAWIYALLASLKYVPQVCPLSVTSGVSLEFVPQMCPSSVSLECVPRVCPSSVSLKCVPQVCPSGCPSSMFLRYVP